MYFQSQLLHSALQLIILINKKKSGENVKHQFLKQVVTKHLIQKVWARNNFVMVTLSITHPSPSPTYQTNCVVPRLQINCVVNFCHLILSNFFLNTLSRQYLQRKDSFKKEFAFLEKMCNNSITISSREKYFCMYSLIF